jgi:hypothetical protein
LLISTWTHANGKSAASTAILCVSCDSSTSGTGNQLDHLLHQITEPVVKPVDAAAAKEVPTIDGADVENTDPAAETIAVKVDGPAKASAVSVLSTRQSCCC